MLLFPRVIACAGLVLALTPAVTAQPSTACVFRAKAGNQSYAESLANEPSSNLPCAKLDREETLPVVNPTTHPRKMPHPTRNGPTRSLKRFVSRNKEVLGRAAAQHSRW